MTSKTIRSEVVQFGEEERRGLYWLWKDRDSNQITSFKGYIEADLGHVDKAYYTAKGYLSALIYLRHHEPALASVGADTHVPACTTVRALSGLASKVTNDDTRASLIKKGVPENALPTEEQWRVLSTNLDRRKLDWRPTYTYSVCPDSPDSR